MIYAWEYSSKTEPRGGILYAAIKTYLQEGDRILDVNCGYAPLAGHLLRDGYIVAGFDKANEPIEYLRREQPRGLWWKMDDAQADLRGYTVLTFLGVTTALTADYSATYLETAKRLIDLNKPRVIMIESADAADQALYAEVKRHIEDTGRYRFERTGNYDAEMKAASPRHYAIYIQAWDYRLWAQRFRDAKTLEELDHLHAWFYQVAGIDLQPYAVMTNGAPRRPEILSLKDKLLLEWIRANHPAPSTILVIAFWNARMAINLAMDGHTVNGVEPYRRAVDVANTMANTLPAEMRQRLRFYWGIAEDLESYGEYDLTVSYCLEHVKDPRQVVRENLKHIKPGGSAYYTPPIAHGTDSPEHLHHFARKDIEDLAPPGYDAEIREVKFSHDAPYNNSFLVRFHEI